MKFGKDKKQEKKDKTESVPEVVLNIHKMPKGYKTGRFEVEKRVVAGQVDNSIGNKKVGVFIIIFGIMAVIAIAYFVLSYVFKNSNPKDAVVNTKNAENIINDSLNNKNNLIGENQSSTVEEATSSSSTEEIIIPEETNSSTASTTNIENEVVPSIDTDNDGLSDDEEFVLGTKYNQIDSDGDTFGDLTEVENLYNPTGNGPITNDINMVKYENKAFSYSIVYPKSFGKSVLTDESSLVLSVDTNSFFQILVEENSNNLTIKDWYADRFFTLVPDSNIISNNVWDGVYDSDGSALYLTDKKHKNVYTILYNANTSQKPYINIFNTIIKSFTLK